MKMCESWLGAMRAPSSAQSCDSTSRLGVEAIAHVHLHLDKRHIKEFRSKKQRILKLFNYSQNNFQWEPNSQK